ncbi:MAG TPA: chloride channel protein [Gemmatimonadaceae bacterium]|nr:chloride channel protein [Gemmatimonadaceae bacterium]
MTARNRIVAAVRRWWIAGGQRRLLLDTMLLAVAGVAAAQTFNLLLDLSRRVFLRGIAGYVPPGLPSEGGVAIPIAGPHGTTFVLLTATLGGLLVGILVEWLAPEAEGHGTDALIRAFHRSGGLLRGRVAPVKLVASAITIGSGGAAGREGPIALVAATVGSWYATITNRDERDRRLLMLVGAAAGLSAIFRSPIGAAFFVIEVLYVDMEFESRAMLYATLAAVLAYALNGLIVGWGALFVVPQVNRLHSPADYAWYALLGVIAGVFSTILPEVFYRTRNMFRAIRIPRWLKPAVGGALTGVVILRYPQVIAGGYGWIQRAIDGSLTASTMAALAFAEMIAMSLTVSSGGSGGVFAPSLFMGGMLGGALASFTGEPTAPFVVVGMAAVFAGAAHVPISTMFMVTEMTGGYTLLVPAALAVMLSYLIQLTLSRGLRYRGLYEAQVASRADSPAHHTQHLEIALRILREKHPVRVESLGEIDLLTLLRSGIPVELADDQRLFVGVLRKDSPVGGTTIAASGRGLAGEGTIILGILRADHMIAPRADVVLTPGDKIIVLAHGDGRLREHLDAW